MYKCLIIDDEELARNLIKNHLSKLDDFEIIASCQSAIEASKVMNEEQIDLLFLDIEMPVLNGMEFYKNLISKPKVIFTTAHRDYAIDGFELNALDYLLKPISFGRFFKAIEKFLLIQSNNTSVSSTIQSNLESEQKIKREYIFVNEYRKKVKILFDDILYIESLKNYIKIETSIKTHIIKQGISSFEKLLDNRFLRIHRSYIINITKITAYTKQDVEIDKIEIPIGENYKMKVEKVLSS
ncbi:LytR/AlgR family response regulator transcription factor [Bernardetia sp. OM2101]|uniref:LytR/AlgR family response regulator transcription factor n=1 Tax=Bernardetia sp. OM2101 TaxID=3344876 RepID=UPI0035D070A4